MKKKRENLERVRGREEKGKEERQRKETEKRERGEREREKRKKERKKKNKKTSSSFMISRVPELTRQILLSCCCGFAMICPFFPLFFFIKK